MVRTGKVGAIDKIGIDFAERAGDFGRRRVTERVIDLRKRCMAACSFWYPLVLELHELHRFSRAVVNEDGRGGTALHPTVWSEGGGWPKAQGLACYLGICLGSWTSWSLVASVPFLAVCTGLVLSKILVSVGLVY